MPPVQKVSWLESKISDTILNDLQSGKLPKPEAEKLAAFVLSKIDNLKTQEDTLLFLSDLAKMYPEFDKLRIMVEGVAERQQEYQTATRVLHLIKKGAAKQAISIAQAQMQ